MRILLISALLLASPAMAQPIFQMTPEQQQETGRRTARQFMEERRQRMERDPEFRAQQEANQKAFEDRIKQRLNEECERQGRLVECRMRGVPR